MERVGAGDRTSWWADGGGDRRQALGDPFPWPMEIVRDSLWEGDVRLSGDEEPLPHLGAFASTGVRIYSGVLSIEDLSWPLPGEKAVLWVQRWFHGNTRKDLPLGGQIQ